MSNLQPVECRHYLYVGLYTAVLYALVLFVGGPLTMHEGVLSQTTKVMLAEHDWLVPHYGAAPWIERPPLPQWISCAICAVLGHCDQEWNVRIGSALAGLLTVLLTVWLAGRLFGRAVGILGGLMLATMYNFLRYATLAEADIFLSPIVAGALCAFAYAEILRIPGPDDGVRFLGKRPWCVLIFFVLLGMTNLAKGLVFGTAITLSVVGVFLLWNFQWQRLRRYCWLWGWLAFCAVALPWPLLVLLRLPDAAPVWQHDLFGRLNSHYLEQPLWYYFECLCWVPQPWIFAALVGLGLTWKKAWRDGSLADRFVWCWAWAPLLVFSLSHGKHHHYMLHYLAPWGVLAAQGGVWAWRNVGEQWQKRWAVPVCIAVAGDLAIAAVFAIRAIHVPAWTLPALLAVFPPSILAFWWFGLHRRPWVSLCGTFALLLVLYGPAFTFKGFYLHRSREDTAFLYAARQFVPLDQPLMINSADEALEGLRMQFYIGDSVYFLHNLSFMCDDRIATPDVYVVTRYNRKAELEKYGQVASLLRCKQSRQEKNADERWALFHVYLRSDLPRRNVAAVRISPMQAMYRKPGPDLVKP